MSEEYINKITIDCLINKGQYKNKNDPLLEKINKHDKKFYRKRIYNLAKELLLSKEEPKNIFPDVKHSFDNFIKSCIDYFKALDNNDIIQGDFNIQDDLNIQGDLNIDILDNINHIDNLDIDNTNHIDNLEEVDKSFIRSINIPKPSLNGFIIKNKIKKSIIIPNKKEINLKDPSLRIKGIIKSEKKKNINNKYDEINKKKENEKDNESNTI